jgi:hypothetical protein
VSAFYDNTETWLNVFQDLRQRYIEKLEKEGDEANDVKDHHVAIGSYSSALSLDPENINDIIVKCCKTRVGYLEDELSTATMVWIDSSVLSS